MGFSREVVIYLKWCLLAVESTVALATTKYIRWRLQLGSAICDCYEDLALKEPTKADRHAKSAAACAVYVQQTVQRLRKEEELDLPLPIEVQRVLEQAETTANMLVARTKAVAARQPITRSLITATFSSASDQIRVTIDAMEKLSRAFHQNRSGKAISILPPAAAASSTTQEFSDLLSLVMEIATPLLKPLLEAEESSHVDETLQTAFPLSFHLIVLQHCYELAKSSEEVALLARSAWIRAGSTSEGLTSTESSMVGCLIPLYEALHEVQQAWMIREAQSEGEQAQFSSKPSPLVLPVSGKTLPAAELLLQLSKATKDCVFHGAGTIARTNRDFLASMALQMWRELVEPVVNELDVTEPTQLSKALVRLACELMLTIHLTFTVVDFEDLLLHGQVCLRLATLLSTRGKARMASQVVRRCLERINARRDDLVRLDSHFHSVVAQNTDLNSKIALSFGSFSCTINDRAYPGSSDCVTVGESNDRDLVGIKGTGSQFGGLHQDLCCIQADLLLLQYRVELQAATDIDCLPLTSADSAPSPTGTSTALAATEAKLVAECRQNGFAKVLLNIQRLAHPSKSVKERMALADESMRLLQRMESQKHELRRQFLQSSATSESTESSSVPAAPVIVSRSSSAITVKVAEYQPSLPSLRKKPVMYYMVFAKPAGAGTAVSVNNNQLPGTAEPIYPPHLHVTIEGLLPNESYVFAVAAFDSKHELIHSIGLTSDPVGAFNPLPMPLCYGYLANVCYEAQLPDRANKAANFLYNAVVSREQATRASWMANPFYRLALKRDVMAQFPVPILNLCINSLLILCHAEPGDLERDGMLASVADVDARSLTQTQTEALEDSRRISIAVEIACAVNNSEAIRVLSFKGYRLLLPLLHLKGGCNGLAFPALMTFYQALHCIPRYKWDDDTRNISARVGFELLRIAQETTGEIARITFPLVTAMYQHQDAAEPLSTHSPVKCEEFSSMREVVALHTLSNSIQSSTMAPDQSTSAMAAASVTSPRGTGTKGGAAAAKEKSQSATPHVTPRAGAGAPEADESGGDGKPQRLDELLQEAGYDLAKAFRILERQCTSDREALEFACKICSAALATGSDQVESVERFLSSLKVARATSIQFRDTLRSLGGEALLPEVEDPVVEKEASDRSAPSSARSGKPTTYGVQHSKDVSLTSADSNQVLESAESPDSESTGQHDVAGVDDEYLYRWCAKLSSNIKQVDATHGPTTDDCTYNLLCADEDRLNAKNPIEVAKSTANSQSSMEVALHPGQSSDPHALAPSASRADSASETAEQHELSASEQLDGLFGQFVSKTAASCRLFRLAKSWQGLQVVTQYLWDTLWIVWMAPSRIGASSIRLGHLASCIDALLDMMDITIQGDTRDQKTPNTTTSAGLPAHSVPLEPAAPVERPSAGSPLSIDQTWLAQLMAYALRAFCASEDWQSIVRKGSRYHFLCGSSPQGNRFSEQNFPLLIYAQQQISTRQETLLTTAEEELSTYVTAYREQEAKKKKNKSRLVVEEVLSPEELAFRATKQDMEQRIHGLTVDRNRERDGLRNLTQLYDGLTKSINKSQQALDTCHDLVEKYSRLAKRHNEDASKESTAHAGLRRQVVAAFSRCVVLSRQKRQKRIVCQALHELGDFYLACGDPKAAVKSWLEALDNAFSALNVTTSWREVLAPIGDQSLGGHSKSDRIAGDELWVGLQSCNVLAKLILQSSGSNLLQTVDYALMAAAIFTRLYGCSLPHPSKCFLYGSYRVLGQFWPGRKLLADPERISAFSLGVMLILVPEVLLQYDHDHQLAVSAMPLLAGYEYVAAYCLKDTNHVANARRFRVEALVQCGRFQEAFQLIADLLHGGELHRTNAGLPDSSIGRFYDDKPLLDEANGAAVNWLLTFDAELTQNQLKKHYPDALVQLVLVSILHLAVALARHESRFDRDAALIRPVATKLAKAMLNLMDSSDEGTTETPRNAADQHSGATPRDQETNQTPRPLPWEELQLHELRGDIILQQSYLAFFDGQWSTSRDFSVQAICEYTANARVFQRPVHLGLDQKLQLSLFNRRSTFIAKCRSQVIACEIAQMHYQAAIALAETAIVETKSTSEEHLRQQLELQRLQAAVFLGKREKIERELVQLQTDFVTHHTSNSIAYARALQTSGLLRRSKALAACQPSALHAVCECLSEAECVLDALLERDGWMGVKDDAGDLQSLQQRAKRLNLYRPALPVFVQVHADLAQVLLECPLKAGSETVQSRREKAQRSIQSGLCALDHTTQRMAATRTWLLLLKGVLLRKALCATSIPASGSEVLEFDQEAETKLLERFEECVEALAECIRLSIAEGGHDRRLIRLALLELVDLFGQKLLPAKEDAHIQAAFHYLNLALQVQSHESVLFDTLELQNGTVTSVEKLPSSICTAINAQSEGQVDDPVASNHSTRPPDTTAIVNYFVRLLRTQYILPICTPEQQETCAFLHSFLSQHHSTYARTSCLTELPAVPSSDPEIRAGLVCAHWGQDLAPALSPVALEDTNSQATRTGRLTLYFTLGTTRVDIETGSSAADSAAASSRMERFASSPLLSKRCEIDRQRVQDIKASLSRLRTYMEDEDSLIIDPNTFAHTLYLILLQVQQLFRKTTSSNNQHQPLDREGDGNGTLQTDVAPAEVLHDTFGNSIALRCTLELVRRLEDLFAIHKGANVADNALCYFLRDLLD
ncbi:hypothetical protein BBJ28_00010444 [Nothophytophthora sp. Chile5]|nr:hypothetical protein BBJ28_00010444 [Nothophytophthora sp. Chile5]